MIAKLPARPTIAIAGATGAVGHELLRVLAERDTELERLRLLASPRSAGRRLRFRDEEIEVEALEETSFRGVDLALFSCGKERSLQFARAAARSGAVVVDNSSAFRLEPDVPLVVPEVNRATLFAGGEIASRIVANPNCSTILLVVALAPLARAFGLTRVVVSTYQAASGAGQRGIDTLRADVEEGGAASAEVFGHPLAFNLVPRIDTFFDDGSTGEERKMILETRKILGLPELTVDATCVRVPVYRCHSESVSIATARPVDPAEARRILSEATGIEVIDDPQQRRYPMPSTADGRDPVQVGRIRASHVFPGGISFWLSGDQLRKGAALNAVQIVEALRGQEVCAP